jgi:hypothetical protein
LREALALVEEVDHLRHLGDDLVDADRVVGQSVVQLAEQVGRGHEIGCRRGCLACFFDTCSAHALGVAGPALGGRALRALRREGKLVAAGRAVRIDATP